MHFYSKKIALQENNCSIKMKFTTDKNLLLKLLMNVCNVASKKNPNNPVILQNIKIDVKNDFLYLTGTDSDTYIKDNGHVLVEDEGSTTVSAQLIYEIVKKIEDKTKIECEYSKEDNVLKIKAGKSKFKLMCLNADGYPNFEEHQMQVEFKMKANTLTKMIEKTRFSISDDPSRYYLNGLFLQTIKDEDGNIKLAGVSTDGHKLSIVKCDCSNENLQLGGVIIPKKALPEIKKVADITTQEDILISLSKTKIKVETEDTIVISKLIDAEFPDYNRVVPKDNDKVLKVNKKDISSVIDRVSTVANDSHKGIKFIIHNNNLILESNSIENGSASEEIKVEFNYDEKIEIGFNSRFILEIFGQIDNDTLEIWFKDGNSAVLIRGAEEKNNIFILMPIRI